MFAHLHNHFLGSYSDSVLAFGPALAKAKSDGQPAMAMTEHGEIPFVREYVETCRRLNLKPIIGAEIYFVEDAAESILRKNPERFHLVVIAKNQNGLRNLYGLLSDAWIKNSYEERRGLVDWELLGKYSDGLLALSGCFYNLVGQKFLRESPEAAEITFKKYLEIFGADYYPEVGKHGIADEDAVNDFWLSVSSRYNRKLVATNDVHYLEPRDWIVHDIIIKTRYDKISSFRIDSQQYWLKTEKEMLADYRKEWLDNTSEVVEKIDTFDLPVGAGGGFGPDISSVYEPRKLAQMFDGGLAAYPAKITYIDEETARQHASEVLQKYSYPEISSLTRDEQVNWVAEKIKNIARRSEPDTNKLVVSDKPLKNFIPLKRSLGKVMTQFSEEDCLALGAKVYPAIPSPLVTQLSKLYRRP